MPESIAIVGMACQFPDSRSPQELWENALAQRSAFRRIPAERLPLRDYGSPDRSADDRTYVTEAAVLEGYEFDRVRFRVVGSTYRSADLTHWLALDIADRALRDAGFPDGEGLPRESTGVVLGNTLTGEFSRAHGLRLRWPYVRRVVEAELAQENWSPERRAGFLDELEARFKAPFSPTGEESLAGGLANTIAGRICNHFDLKGGGYTVDGACASSLLSISTACSALVAGDLDVVLAGGVDVSLDPFELVGFARVGALAPEKMRVYDARVAGFWPGEGCGCVVLMRQADAARERRRIYASIRGWGISSDGRGGLTRPELEGQVLALCRAYRRAGFGPESISYFEGHGTGTEVGDAIELRALSRVLREAGVQARPAAVGSIKANIGHTKAAAGVAGLIKAVLALDHQMIPPTSGCERPHPALAGEPPVLRVVREGEAWPPDRPLRAGVSSMGFGGINTHLVLEGAGEVRRRALMPHEVGLLTSAQDTELLLFGDAEVAGLRRRIEQVARYAGRLSRAEIGDLAATLAGSLERRTVRAALVASRPAELEAGLEMLSTWLADGETRRLDFHTGVFLDSGVGVPQIGFLFTGQGSPLHRDGGALRRRFAVAREVYARAEGPCDTDDSSTAVAQPAIATATLAGLRVLAALGVEASVGLGHSLGEISALHWGGALDGDALRRIATARGRVMAELGSSTGAMASIAAGPGEVAPLLEAESVVIAGFNAPRQTVVSGEAAAVERVLARAREAGFTTTRLRVSRAFHSPLVAECGAAFEAELAGEHFQPLCRRVVSTVTGGPLDLGEDLRRLLLRQVTDPVRFTQAVTAASRGLDLWIEVGPGKVLSELAQQNVEVPATSVDAGAPELEGLLRATGAAFALGAPVNPAALFEGRFTRPFDLAWNPRFFVNPCEQGRSTEAELSVASPPSRPRAPDVSPHPEPYASPPESTLELVRELVAARTELPPSSVGDDDRLLSDLHLSSIVVSQLVAEAARRSGLPAPVQLSDYADATVGEIAVALETLEGDGAATPSADDPRLAPGVDTWVRRFRVDWLERPLMRQPIRGTGGGWQLVAPVGDSFGKALLEAFESWGGDGGILVHLPSDLVEARTLALLVDGAQRALAGREPRRFVLVQHAAVGGAVARTLHLEARALTTCVVEVPEQHPQALSWVVAEAQASVGYTESRYTSDGRRFERRLQLLPSYCKSEAELPLSERDVLLVTGGGKGIAAEAALALARETGVRLALVGRARPEQDEDLARNLERVASSGAVFRYFSADVCDPEAVRAVTQEVVAEFGPVTAFFHGAGTNVPHLLTSLDPAAFERTLAPKLRGAENVLAALDPGRLRFFVSFGSLIAEVGMAGEADYALANDWLARLTERFQTEHPGCRCHALEWSVWSGVGMGERLGRIDALARQGIVALSPDQGCAALQQTLVSPDTPVAVVITGRFGRMRTLAMETPELPLLRFLEETCVHTPGVELVVEASLSAESDPYLDDHVIDGERLLPGVMLLEAMAQAAGALASSETPPLFENVVYHRPVVVPEGASVRLRVAALVRASDRVDVAVRSETTAFQVNHVEATCRFDAETATAPELTTSRDAPELALNPERDLYGDLLFHAGRFRRLRSFRRIAADGCLAEIAENPRRDWFGHYLPQSLVLGDPGVRDAAIHAIQVCVPDATLLPIGVERIVPGVGKPPAPGPCFACAAERTHEGDTFSYDLEITDAGGTLRERWVGLQLRKVAGSGRASPGVAALLVPYLERRVSESFPGVELRVAIERGVGPSATDRAIQGALAGPVRVLRRPDGKPEVDGALAVSASHAEGWTLAVAGSGPVGCDLEAVRLRSERDWRDLLGPDRFALADLLAREADEELSTSATRVWTAGEAMKKAGANAGAPLVHRNSPDAGVCVLSAGALDILTLPLRLHEVEPWVVVALLVRNADARL